MLFSGSDYPYLLLYDEPVDYLKKLLSKISSEKNDVLNEYLNLINSQIYDWYCEGNSVMNEKIIDDICELILHCNPVNVIAYSNIFGWLEKFEKWEKIIAIMKEQKHIVSFILMHERPVEAVEELIGKIPLEFSKLLIGAISEMALIIGKTKPDEKKYGWRHNMNAISQDITKLMIKIKHNK